MLRPRLLLPSCAIFVLLSLIAGCDGSSSPGGGDWRASVERYSIQGNYKAAAIEVKNALKAAPKDAEIRLLLGELQVKQQDYAGAEKELKRALSLGLNLERAAPLLATVYFQRGKWQELLDEVPAELIPDSRSGWVDLKLQRAVAYTQLGQAESAVRAYEEILAVRPGHGKAILGLGTLALAKADFIQADSLLDAAMKAAPADPAVWLQIGKLRYQQHRYDDAILSFKRALKRNRSPQKVHIGLAWAYMANGRFDLARKEALIVRKQNRDHPLANYLLAALAFKDGDNKAAQDYLNFASKHGESRAQTVLLSAANNQALGNFSQAESLLRDFLKTNPNFLPAQTILAEVLHAQGRSKAAFEGLQMAAKRVGAEDAVALDLAKLALKDNRPNDAKAYLDAAISAGDTRADVLAARSKLEQGFMHRAAALLENLGEATGKQLTQDAVSDAEQLIDRERVDAVKLAVKQGDLAQAGALAKELVSDYPDTIEALNLLGTIQAARGNIGMARESFGRAAALQPNSPRAARNLFILDMGLKDYAAARKLLDRELKKYPLDVDLLFSRAKVAMLLGDASDSIQWLEKVLEINPALVSARVNMARLLLARGDGQSAAPIIEKAYNTNPNNPNVLELLGQVAEASGNVGEAEIYYQKLVDAAPEQIAGYDHLITLQMSEGDVQAATRTLQEMLNQIPDHAPAAIELVRLYQHAENNDAALRVARSFQQAAPESTIGYVLEADIKSATGANAEAEPLYSGAFEREPSLAIAVALYRVRMRSGAEDSAIDPLKQWVNSHHGDMAGRVALADALVKRGDSAAAIRQLKSVLELDAENFAALNNLANMLYDSGDKKQALLYAERAYRGAPDVPAVADTWGWMLVNNGRSNEAVKPLTAAATAMPGSPEIAYHLAAALDSVGRTDDAQAYLRRALSGDDAFAGRKDAQAMQKKLEN